MSMRQQPTNHTRTIPAIKHKNRLRTVFNNEQNPHRTESCWCPPPQIKQNCERIRPETPSKSDQL